MDAMLDMKVGHAVSAATVLRKLNLDVPAGLTAAMDRLAAAEAFDVEEDGAAWELELAGAEPDAIPAILAKAADVAARGPAAADVRRRAVTRLSREVVVAAREAGPAIIDALADVFNEAARELEACVAELPDGWQDLRKLRAAGGPAVEAYLQAEGSAAILDKLKAIRDGLAGQLGVKAEGPAAVELGCRYATVIDQVAATRAAEALNVSGGDIHPWAALLATEGVTGLQWRSLADQAALMRKLPAPDPFPKAKPVGGGFVGAKVR